MNRIHTSLAIICLCTAVVGWQVWQQKTSPESAAASGVNLPDPAAETPSPSTRSDSAATDTDLRSAIPAQDTEQILGYSVLKDRNCDVEVHYITDQETGEVHEAMSCVPRDPAAPHPYESWSDETLAGLAYGDAKAAEVLGLRHIRSEDPAQETLGLSLLYRSVALSGEPSAFRRAIGIRYAHVSINGEPQIRNLKQLLVFNVMGDALGHAQFNPDVVENELRSLNVSDAEIQRLRTGSRDLLQQMGDLQAEITGSQSIREALENA